MSSISDADYNHTLTCPLDMLSRRERRAASSQSKTLCPHGVVCCVKMELFPSPDTNKHYTGLLTPGTTNEHCIMRLSSAMKPPNLEIKSKWARALLYATGEKLRTAKLFPSAALKVFRKGRQSGNLLFGGSKVGQREADFFSHCQCTSMTEQMPRMVKPFVRKFWEYSEFPLSLGCSDFCKYDGEGEEVSELNFPFAVILRPRLNVSFEDDQFADSFDGFLDKFLHMPVGTVLFDIFACPKPIDVPDPSKLQRIGRITITSEIVQSAPDDGLFFRHQKKEEDYDLRPDWPEALQAQVTIDGGKTKGTIGKLAGWKLFEQHIEENGYIDFEKT